MRLTLEERLWPKVKKTRGCWRWIGNLDKNGYGQFWANGKLRSAHVVVYELLVGPIPDGLWIDHLCRNHDCVNPAHLEAVTPKENNIRGVNPKYVAHRTNTCMRGHDLNEAYVCKTTGTRKCRKCRNDRRRKNG